MKYKSIITVIIITWLSIIQVQAQINDLANMFLEKNEGSALKVYNTCPTDNNTNKDIHSIHFLEHNTVEEIEMKLLNLNKDISVKLGVYSPHLTYNNIFHATAYFIVVDGNMEYYVYTKQFVLIRKKIDNENVEFIINNEESCTYKKKGNNYFQLQMVSTTKTNVWTKSKVKEWQRQFLLAMKDI